MQLLTEQLVTTRRQLDATLDAAVGNLEPHDARLMRQPRQLALGAHQQAAR